MDNKKITLGISSCLLGNKVRYDGTHKRDKYITETLTQFFTFIPVCPEVECGLPVPREPMRLIGDKDNPRLVTIKSNKDITQHMAKWGKTKVKELTKLDLCGFIFKSKSPSSGMERVKIYDNNGVPNIIGTGIFAKLFMKAFPFLPVEEEGRIHDPVLRENFIENVFVYKRWQELNNQFSTGKLVDFHTKHKYQIRSHSEKIYRQMGKLVAGAGVYDSNEILLEYHTLLMSAMKLKPTIKKHTNVLIHLMGYFKKMLSQDEKQELLEVIEQFRNNLIPLIVPITLISHYTRKYRQSYLMQQSYLTPHPLELKLRNHA